MKFSIGVLSSLLVLVTHVNATAQGRFVPNYDETAIPDYELPACLITNEGKVVRPKVWENKTRGNTGTFESEVYGRSPEACKIPYKTISKKNDALGGKAVRREVDVTMQVGSKSTTMRLLITRHGQGSRTCYRTEFQGNHTVDASDEISITDNWRNRGASKTTGECIHPHCSSDGQSTRLSSWIRAGDDLLRGH